MEYMCPIWPRICSTCRKHFRVLSSFMTNHRVRNYINATGATSEAATAPLSHAPEFTPCFIGVHVSRSLVLCVCFVNCCLSFFFWSLCFLSFFDLQILITTFVSSNLSKKKMKWTSGKMKYSHNISNCLYDVLTCNVLCYCLLTFLRGHGRIYCWSFNSMLD